MIRALAAALILFTVVFGGHLQAQTVAAPDYDAWAATAKRGEDVVAAGRASDAALEVLRAEIARWRAEFLTAEATNADRIATVNDQLSALGVLQEGETEAPELAARRAALQEQLRVLRTPALRAEEAFNQADGLIGEIDRIIRARQTTVLLTLGPSPVNPANWPSAYDAVVAFGDELVTEVRGSLTSVTQRALVQQRLPLILGLVVVGGLLLLRSRRLLSPVARFATLIRRPSAQWLVETVLRLLVYLAPVLGLILIGTGLTLAGGSLLSVQAVLEVLAAVLLMVSLAAWLGDTLFPADPDARGMLGVAVEARGKARRLLASLGLTAGFFALPAVLVPGPNPDLAALAVLSFPLFVFGAWFSFRLGRLLTRTARAPVDPDTEETRDPTYRDRSIAGFGRIIMLVAALGLLAATVGYFRAAEAILGPLVITIGLLAGLVVLNRAFAETYALLTGARPDGTDERLLPTLMAFALGIAAIPLLALIWGARVADLTELWTRLLNGFSVGGIRISPSVLFTLLVVFAIGYALTRFLQGTLRNSILPKTRLDAGGQTAVVSGVGYVGIFLAAITAITTAGLNLSNLAIVAGALSVGVGFGLQTIVSNFVSGIILLVERPVSEGDMIEVGGVLGTVRKISVRSTRIETFDRTDVIVPNADLISNQVTNWTKTNLTTRLIVPIGVAYGTDTRHVEAILTEIAALHPMVILKPPPQILFVGFGADSLNFEIRVILRDLNFKLTVQTEINHEIAARFDKEGIEIPFAQRDVWIRNPEALTGTQPQVNRGET